MAHRAALLAAVALLAGLLFSMGSYTFVYARGYSYMSDRSEACTNCHVMQGQYDGWIKGSHKHVANCNDCHTPPGTAAKYLSKAMNGYNHSWAFSTGRYKEPLLINDTNRNITEKACLKCHQEVFHNGSIAEPSSINREQCLRCHSETGHK